MYMNTDSRGNGMKFLHNVQWGYMHKNHEFAQMLRSIMLFGLPLKLPTASALAAMICDRTQLTVM